MQSHLEREPINVLGVATPESIRDTIELVAANLEAFFAGEPLLSPAQL